MKQMEFSYQKLKRRLEEYEDRAREEEETSEIRESEDVAQKS